MKNLSLSYKCFFLLLFMILTSCSKNQSQSKNTEVPTENKEAAVKSINYISSKESPVLLSSTTNNTQLSMYIFNDFTFTLNDKSIKIFEGRWENNLDEGVTYISFKPMLGELISSRGSGFELIYESNLIKKTCVQVAFDKIDPKYNRKSDIYCPE